MLNIACVGEVLWDVFPTHKTIGGAPLNIALRLSFFKNNVSIITSVGKDEDGDQILSYIQKNNLNTKGIQIAKEYNTGIAKVLLDESKSATYDLKHPSAWDKITLTPTAKELVKNSDILVYGSLIARDEQSRDTLYQLLKTAKTKVLDINLRAPYYSLDVLNHLMQESDFIKFNDSEIIEISNMNGFKASSLEEYIGYVKEKFDVNNICVTKGKDGSILSFKNKIYYNGGYKVKVIDTVGAGDSFFATLLSKLYNDVEPQKALNYASAVGALVTANAGANPKLSVSEIEKLL